MSFALNSDSKVLIIRFSSIGDLILCSPVVRSIFQQKKCEIHFLTKEKYKNLIQFNPYISKTITYRGEDGILKNKLRKENYNLVIDLHKNIRSVKVSKWLDCPRITFDKLNVQKWLKINLKLDFLPDTHIVDRYYNMLSDVGINNDKLGLDFFIDPHIDITIPSDNYIVLVVGAGHHTKAIPVKKSRDIISGMSSPVVLVGGDQFIDWSEQIEAGNTQVVNFVGKTSIHQSALLIKHSRLIISGDTGMMHIAAALKKPIFSIWGNTIPAFGMTPYYGAGEVEHKIFEMPDLECRPCSKLGFRECPKGHFKCMHDISSNEVISQINDFIKRN